MNTAEVIEGETLRKMFALWAAFFILKEKELGSREAGEFPERVVFNKDNFMDFADLNCLVEPPKWTRSGRRRMSFSRSRNSIGRSNAL